MKLNRREALATAALSSAAMGIVSHLPTPSVHAAQHKTLRTPCFVSTWSFGKVANDKSLQVLKSGGSLLDSIEQGIMLVEQDAANSTVGLGGTPNAAGVVQLDACIMTGAGHRAGSVAALEGFVHPISVARRVMEKTPHVMLVGTGAAEFARLQGFKSADLLTVDQEKAFAKWKAEQAAKADPVAVPIGHDTIALVGVDEARNMAGGCSTSGLGYKLPGRVGDSPILGSGLYVDNEIGAAGATGIGENVMRFCGTFMVVEGMRHGLSPLDACVSAVRRIARLDGRPLSELRINFIALDRNGNSAAAGTDEGFDYAVTHPDGSEVKKAERIF